LTSADEFKLADGVVVNSESIDNDDGSSTLVLTPRYPEYKFTVQFGDGFEKQTGKLVAHLRHGLLGHNWEGSYLTQDNKEILEFSPNTEVTFTQQFVTEKFNKLTMEWEKTGSEEGNVVNIKKVVVKSVRHPDQAIEFTNNKPLVSGNKVDFVKVK